MAKKRSKYDLIDEEILNYQILNETAEVPKSEIAKILKSNIDIPDAETLQQRYISSKVSSYLARKKNLDGTRKFLSNGNGSFSLIESERDVTNLDGVLNQLNKRVDGLTRNIRKTKKQKYMVENQVSMDELKEAQQ